MNASAICCPPNTEAQTEEELVRPALEILGWLYIIQPNLGRGANLTRPDSVLFADAAMRREAPAGEGR